MADALPLLPHPDGSPRGKWAAANVCIAYVPSEGYHLGAVVRTRPADDSAPWRAVHWPPAPTEGGKGSKWLPARGASYIAQGDKAQQPWVAGGSWARLSAALMNLTSARTAWNQRAVAFVPVITMDNLWHALFHAIPTNEFVERLRRDGRLPRGAHVDVYPRYTIWMPVKKCSRASNATGARHCEPSRVASWKALELLTRSLEAGGGGGESGLHWPSWERVAANTDELFFSGRLRCYREVYGGHAEFWPSLGKWRGAYNVSGLLAARPRFHELRQRLARSIGSDARAGARVRVGAGIPASHAAAAAAAAGGSGGGSGSSTAAFFLIR